MVIVANANNDWRTTHGLSRHPLYRIWTKIKERLYNPNHEAYHRYGGRGVKMCKEWINNPVAFINWALDNGWKKGLHVDKDIKAMKLGIEPLEYSPEMCSIVSPKENCRNASYNIMIEYNGKKQCLMDWCEELGFDQATMHHRIFDYNYTIEEAFTLKPKQKRKSKLVEYNGEYDTIAGWSRKFGINKGTLRERILKMPISEAIKIK